jgi:polyhydroxybutyrate depolymerase
LITETVDVGDMTRRALVYVPQNLPPAALVPIILFFHGGGSTALAASRVYGFDQQADARGFIVVYPDGSELPSGSGRYWNEGNLRRVELLPDDVRFFDQLLDLLLARYPVDPSRVFLAGQSNGGGMAYRLACERAERIAAIAVSAPTFFAPVCEPAAPVSIVHIHGTADPTIPYVGVTDRRGTAPSVPEAVALWSARNGCAAGPLLDMVNAVVERETHTQCEETTEVVHYAVLGGEHCWPGIERGNQRTCPPGGPHMSLSATSLATNFLLAHPRR